METIVTKVCNICGHTLPVSEFYWNRTRKGIPYPNSRCKKCCGNAAKALYDKQAQREHRRVRAEHFRNYTTQYQRSHPLKFLLASAKSNAKRRGIEFSIEIDDLVVPETCPYLDIPLQVRILHGKGRGHVSNNSASIDRIDSTKGYIKGNVQIISHLANRMKNSATQEQLITFARNVLRMYER